MLERKDLSFLDVCFSTVKTAIGIGLLYLPSQLAKTGFLGVFVVFFFGILSSISLYACSRTTETTEKYNYFGLSEKTIGTTGKWLVFVSFFVYIGGTCLIYFGTMVLYLMHLTGFFFPFLETKKWFELIVTIIIFFLVLVFSSTKNTRVLAKIATAGFIGILYTIFVLILNFFIDKKEQKEHKKTSPSVVSFASFFSSVGFSYANNFTYMAGIKELDQKTNRKKNWIILISGVIETVTYMVVACLGYYLFPEIGNYSPSDLLSVGSNSSTINNHYSKKLAIVNSPLMAVFYKAGIGIMFLVILCSFPLFLNSLREMLLEAIKPTTTQGPIFFHILNFILCFFFSIFSFLLDINQIDNMLKYVSGFIGGFICFIFPAIFFLKTELSKTPKKGFDVATFLLVFLTGIVCIVSFFLTFI